MMRILLMVAVMIAAAPSLASTFSVTTTADSGPGSLRQAILDANAEGGSPTIAFSIGEGGRKTICPLTPLPEITTGVLLDGWTQVGWVKIPIIEIDGSCSATGSGLVVHETTGAILRGVVVNSWPDHGIHLRGGGSHIILGVFAGTDLFGNVAKANGRAPSDPTQGYAGITIDDSNDNRIGGTTEQALVLASGNNGYGILGRNAHRNKVWNSFVGTMLSGNDALPNTATGIWFQRSGENEVGGAAAVYRVVASGNKQYGVGFSGVESIRNKLFGSYIGTNKSGTAAVANERTGVLVFNAPETEIGGESALYRNVISGNLRAGINLDGSLFGSPPAPDSGVGNCRDTLITNNYIGTNATGTAAIPNGLAGIRIFKSQLAQIKLNLISGNLQDGIIMQSDPEMAVYDLIARWNRVEGNRIGVAATTGDAIPNGRYGIFIQGELNHVGASTPETGNTIRRNIANGVRIKGPLQATNTVSAHNEISINGADPQVLRGP